MRLHRWNGEHWWVDDKSVIGRIARWALWVGGGKHVWPVSLLGHRVTFFSWGWQLRMKGGWWVVSDRRRSVYWSPDGTPSSATVWLRGGDSVRYEPPMAPYRGERERVS